MHSVELTDEALQEADATVIVTDHSVIDYARVAERSKVVVDTRGVTAGLAPSRSVIGLSRSTVLAGSHAAD
jgi:UDP-N-acetyl-D-glucosamine dehydrogenase